MEVIVEGRVLGIELLARTNLPLVVTNELPLLLERKFGLFAATTILSTDSQLVRQFTGKDSTVEGKERVEMDWLM